MYKSCTTILKSSKTMQSRQLVNSVTLLHLMVICTLQSNCELLVKSNSLTEDLWKNQCLSVEHEATGKVCTWDSISEIQLELESPQCVLWHP